MNNDLSRGEYIRKLLCKYRLFKAVKSHVGANCCICDYMDRGKFQCNLFCETKDSYFKLNICKQIFGD
jgi:hypothetical protein